MIETTVIGLGSTFEEGIVAKIAGSIKEIDEELFEHSVEVAKVAKKIGKLAGLSEEDIQFLELAGYIHDFGKLIDPIVHETTLIHGDLDERQYKIVQKHVDDGVVAAEILGINKSMLIVIGQHHERPDGQGYPNHLTEDEIDSRASILHIADAWTAMTMRTDKRQKPLTPQGAFNKMYPLFGKEFSSQFQDAFRQFVLQTGKVILPTTVNPRRVVI